MLNNLSCETPTFHDALDSNVQHSISTQTVVEERPHRYLVTIPGHSVASWNPTVQTGVSSAHSRLSELVHSFLLTGAPTLPLALLPWKHTYSLQREGWEYHYISITLHTCLSSVSG